MTIRRTRWGGSPSAGPMTGISALAIKLGRIPKVFSAPGCNQYFIETPTSAWRESLDPEATKRSRFRSRRFDFLRPGFFDRRINIETRNESFD
jgi:hypothetical protein